MGKLLFVDLTAGDVKEVGDALCKLSIPEDAHVALVNGRRIANDVQFENGVTLILFPPAFHGLHGRALTYATGIKMARPDLKVIVTMGDAGFGIGGAHVLSTCRRNIDLRVKKFGKGSTSLNYTSMVETRVTTNGNR